MKRAVIFVFAIIAMCVSLQAKNVRVKGSYTFYAPASMSMQEAEQEAIRAAQLDALANEFGHVLVQNTTSVLTERDERFYQLNNIQEKGEWIETIGEPKIERSFSNDGFCIKCTIEGWAREIESAKTDIDFKILCNHPEAKYEHTEFKEGDKLYVHFRSAEKGYIAIYLYDKEKDRVMCMLPYLRDTHSVNSIEGDKKYVFFSKEMNQMPVRAKEYKMGCSADRTVNTVYILFSKKEFTKPMLTTDDSQRSLPSISYEKFQKWLIKCQSNDDTFMVLKRNIQISKE